MLIRRSDRGYELGPMSAESADDACIIPGTYRRVSNSGRDFYVAGTLDAVRAAATKLGERPDDPPARVITFASPLEVPLFPYQMDGVQKLHSILCRRGGAILADDMGLGKTRQAIVVAASLAGRRLIVCPASVRESWRRELVRAGILSLSVSILGPPSDKRYDADWARGPTAPWAVVSYELVERALEQCFARQHASTLIIDEAHGIKGRRNPRSVKLEQLSRQVPYRLALTGTPIWDRPRDFYQLLKVVAGGAFGSAFAFDQRYCGAVQTERGNWDNRGVSNAGELRERLIYYMVRRERGEVAGQLPRLRREIRFVDGTREALAATTAWRLQTANINDALAATLEAKMDAAVELAVEAKKFLLFTWQKAHVKKLWQKIEAAGVACSYITGDFDTAKRQAIIDDARAKGVGIVATIDSCGTGVDGLQHVASIGIFHALDYVPQKLLQAEARINRIGQSLPVAWYYLVMKDTVEEQIVERCINKLDAFTDTVGVGDSAELAKVMSAQAVSIEDELRSLYAAMPEGES